GCVTCPWHGHQFNPEDGCAPAPFTDRVPTYRLRFEHGQLWVHPEPMELGVRVEPILLEPRALEGVEGETA
ncbi:MAG: (2Fe-2S)-binding protein, partial [Pseudomonadota bacterium]